MVKRLGMFGVVAGVLVAACGAWAQGPEGGPAAIARARDAVFPSLVNIDVVTLSFRSGKEYKSRATGSGTIITPEGHIVTNAHVTGDGVKYWVTLVDKQKVPATLVGEDPLTDLAVLKIDNQSLSEPERPLPAAAFGDSGRLAVGDFVLAMGSPFSLSRSVTLGIISNTERVFVSQGEVEEMSLDRHQRTGLFTNWLQHDALILPGNSGGPLVNLHGEIVGVNTRGGMGLSFATPSNLARAVVERLIEDGEVERSWAGVGFKQTDGTGIERGVLLESVDRDGPAHASGLLPGDIITRVDGRDVNVRFAEEIPGLLRRLSELPIGTSVEIAYERAGEARTANLVTQRLLKDRGDEAAMRTWGLTAQEITPRMARQRRLPSTAGAIVSSVRSGASAALAEPPIQHEDIIRSIDGREVDHLRTLVDIYAGIEEADSKPEHLLVEFERAGKNYFSLLKPKPDERPDPPPELPKAWIGIATQPVDRKMAEKLGHPGQRGYRVIRVYGETNAAAAGLQTGDLITAFDGEQLAPRGEQDAAALARMIRRLPIDGRATMSIVRRGEPLEVAIQLERTRTTPEEAKRDRNTDFDLVVREVTFFDRQDNRWEADIRGVIVDTAEHAGWAGLGGIRSGDLIQRIGSDEITDLDSYKRAMETITEAKPDRVVFVVLRGIRTSFKFVEPEWTPVAESAPDQGEG